MSRYGLEHAASPDAARFRALWKHLKRQETILLSFFIRGTRGYLVKELCEDPLFRFTDEGRELVSRPPTVSMCLNRFARQGNLTRIRESTRGRPFRYVITFAGKMNLMLVQRRLSEERKRRSLDDQTMDILLWMNSQKSEMKRTKEILEYILKNGNVDPVVTASALLSYSLIDTLVDCVSTVWNLQFRTLFPSDQKFRELGIIETVRMVENLQSAINLITTYFVGMLKRSL